MSVLSYIALGSNLDDPPRQLDAAIQLIAAEKSIELVKQSKYYLSKPLGPQNQADFVNAVIACYTVFSPLELLDFLKSIEKKQGRVHIERWGPRIIDLDILFYGEQRVNLPNLIIPHPEISRRDFVLTPLAELKPDLQIYQSVIHTS